MQLSDKFSANSTQSINQAHLYIIKCCQRIKGASRLNSSNKN